MDIKEHKKDSITFLLDNCCDIDTLLDALYLVLQNSNHMTFLSQPYLQLIIEIQKKVKKMEQSLEQLYE